MGEIKKVLDFIESNRTATFTSASFSVRPGIVTSGIGYAPAKISAFADATSVTGTTPNWTIKFQYSYDDVLFTDVPSGAFTAITAASKRELNGIAWVGAASYGRYVGTLNSGTATDFDFTLKIIMHD